MLENQGKKLVYVACPFGGKKEAVEKTKDAIRWFYHRDMMNGDINYVYVSPVLSFGFMYNEVDYQEGIEQCMELLARCDEITFLKGWEDSKGCCMEHGYAMAKNIAITYSDVLDDDIKKYNDDLKYKREAEGKFPNDKNDKENSINKRNPLIDPSNIGSINPFRVIVTKPLKNGREPNPLVQKWCETITKDLQDPKFLITPKHLSMLQNIPNPEDMKNVGIKRPETTELRSIDMGDNMDKYIVNKDNINVPIYKEPSCKSKIIAILAPDDSVGYDSTLVNDKTDELWFKTASGNYIKIDKSSVILM